MTFKVIALTYQSPRSLLYYDNRKGAGLVVFMIHEFACSGIKRLFVIKILPPPCKCCGKLAIVHL